MTPLAPDWWRPTLLRTAVRYPGICEHPRTSEITTLGEARPHVLCNGCGADWYGPGFREVA